MSKGRTGLHNPEFINRLENLVKDYGVDIELSVSAENVTAMMVDGLVRFKAASKMIARWPRGGAVEMFAGKVVSTENSPSGCENNSPVRPFGEWEDI
jgi:hypothetical protein